MESSLETAYQIGRHIQSCGTTDPEDRESARVDSTGGFSAGPVSIDNQTKQGFILEEEYGIPTKIYTPLGRWRFINAGGGDWNQVIEKLKGPLGLTLFKPMETRWDGCYGPWWAVTKWNGQDLGMPSYKDRSEYISDDKVIEAWNQFVTEKGDPKLEKQKTWAELCERIKT